MRKVLFALLAMACVCPACIKPLCQDTIDCVGIVRTCGDLIDEKDSIENTADSVIGIANKCQKSNDSLCQIISNNITVETITKAQEFYRDAFNQIQNNFSFFIDIVVGILTAFTLVTGYSFFKNLNVTENIEKKIKDEIERIERKLVEEREKDRKDFKSNRDSIFREIGHSYIISAKEALQNDEITHFLRLCDYFYIFWGIKIELTNEDLLDFEDLYSFTKKYREKEKGFKFEINNHVQSYLSSFYKFMQYCDITKKEKHYEEAKKIWEELRKIYREDDLDYAITGESKEDPEMC